MADTRKPHPMKLRVEWAPDGPEPLLGKVDHAGWVLNPLRAHFTDARLNVTLDLSIRNGTPTCVAYTVERIDGRGLEEMTTEIATGLNLRAMMAHAYARAVVEFPDDGPMQHATTIEAIESVVGSIRRRRAPITDDRLREFAEAFHERWIPGHARQFAESLFISERQMWRLKKLAEDRGFLSTDGRTS